MTIRLTEKEYKNTMTKKMVDITETADAVVDIWGYVQQLTIDREVLDYIHQEQFVEKVFRNDKATFDHVSLPTESKNVFIVIVVDLTKKQYEDIFT